MDIQKGYEKYTKVVKKGNEEITYISQAYMYGPNSQRVISDEINIPAEKKVYYDNGNLKSEIIYGYQRIAEEQFNRTMPLKSRETQYHENGKVSDNIQYFKPEHKTRGYGGRAETEFVQEEMQHVYYKNDGKLSRDVISAGGPGYLPNRDNWALKETYYKDGEPVSVSDIYQNPNYDKNNLDDNDAFDFYNRIKHYDVSEKGVFGSQNISVDENGKKKVESGWGMSGDHIFSYVVDEDGQLKTTYEEKDGKISVLLNSGEFVENNVENNMSEFGKDLSITVAARGFGKQGFLSNIKNIFPKQYMENGKLSVVDKVKQRSRQNMTVGKERD